jgi:putative ABC transport system permease protein
MESAPIVTMRLRAVDGTPVAELMKNGIGPRWIYQREFRSTFRETLNATESLVAGEFNGQAGIQPGEVPVSLEKKIAADLRVAPGDTLDIDVQGVALAARVTSIREVDWSRFNLNFFMVFPPSALEGAPAFHVVTARVPDGGSAGPMQNALAKAYPNVSVIDLGLVLGTVANVVGNIVTVIRVLAGFTLLAGSAIIIGTFLNGRDQRVRESVLLRTLGASSAQIRKLLVIEYATLGTLSALTGIVLAQAAAFLLAKFAFKAAPVWSPGVTIAIGAGAVLLSVLAGLATSRGVCRHPPLDVLRQIG